MRFCDIDTGEELQPKEVLARASIGNRTASISLSTVSDNRLASYGVARVIEVEPPSVESWQTAVRDGFEKVGDEWRTKWVVTDPTLEQAREYKAAEITARYEQEKLAPVTSSGAQWKGGFESAQGIDGATRLAENLGLTSVTLYDVTGQSYQKTIAEAKAVATDVGIAYQQVYGIKAARLHAIATAETVAEVLAVEWGAS